MPFLSRGRKNLDFVVIQFLSEACLVKCFYVSRKRIVLGVQVFSPNPFFLLDNDIYRITVFVLPKDLQWVQISDSKEAFRLLKLGLKHQSIASKKLNTCSSRR